MALTTFTGLKSGIAAWLHRSDLTSVIPDFVALAEANIRRDVRCRAMETTATGTLSASTLALPSDFLEMRRLVVGDDVQRYITPTEWYDKSANTDGQYTIVGSTLHLQSSTDDYQIDYYAAFAALADDGDTNWLLTNAPEIYLYGSLVEAALYVAGDPTLYAQKYAAAIERLRASEQRARHGGPLTVRSEVYY